LANQEKRKGALPSPASSTYSLLTLNIETRPVTGSGSILPLKNKASLGEGQSRYVISVMCIGELGLIAEGSSGGNRQLSGSGKWETREAEIETCNSGLRTDIISLSFSVRTEVNCPLGRTKPKKKT
jgi:hypothetical protein